MKIVTGCDQAVAKWVASRIPDMDQSHGFGPNVAALGVCSEDGDVLGGVVFHDWRPKYGSIEVSFASASPRWLTPALVTAILDYPFRQLACQRLTSVTPSRAASALRFLQKFGFRREGLVRRAFGTDDAIISGLLAEEWALHRFNRSGVNGKAQPSGRA